MKTFTRDYNIREYRDEAYDRYFGGLKGCVFDIETTGFIAKGGKCKVILTAMLVPTDKGVRVTQYLAEDPYEEDRVIQKTMEFFAENEIDYIITYNGASFDVPFMRDRIEFLNLPYEFNMYNLDLYTFLKKYSILPNHLESLRQKSVETYFGLNSHRKDTIDGRESVKLYFEYVTTHDSVTEKIILTHNREDVVQLYKILIAAGRSGFRDILGCESFDYAVSRFGMPAGDCADLTAQVQVMKTGIRVRGRQRRAPKLQREILESMGRSARPVRVYYDESAEEYPISARLFPDSDEDMSIEFTGATHSFELKLPVQRHGDSSYCDLMKLGCTEAMLDRYDVSSLDGFVNGYLILIDEFKIQQLEVNTLTRIMCDIAMDRISSL